MEWHHYLISFALILAVLDLFLAMELTIGSCFILAFTCTAKPNWPLGWLNDAYYPLAYTVLFLFFLTIFLLIYWNIYRKFVTRFVNNIIAKDNYVDSNGALIGKHGTCVELSGKLLIKIEGEIYTYRTNDAISAGDSIEVIDMDNNTLIVKAS